MGGGPRLLSLSLSILLFPFFRVRKHTRNKKVERKAKGKKKADNKIPGACRTGVSARLRCAASRIRCHQRGHNGPKTRRMENEWKGLSDSENGYGTDDDGGVRLKSNSGLFGL